jgi:DHA2 family methylenomycin A resistance protein-like MFS transporter
VATTHAPDRSPGTTATAATLAVASAAFFMVGLDVTIVNVALPTLARDLDAGLQDLQWIVDGYTLVFAAGLLGAGALGDRLGARGTFAAGLALFALASAACGLAPSTGALVAARFAQGLGAALLVPCSLALLRHTYTDPVARARAIAVWAGAGGAAIAAGPVAGGLLIDAAGWRSIFLVNVLVGATGLVVVARRVASVAGVGRRLDVGGQVTAVLAVGGLTYALIEGPRLGWTDPSVVAAAAASLIGAAGFAACETRALDPMLPPALARRRPFAGAALTGCLLNLAFYGQVFVLSLFFQQVRGESALEAGLSFLPMTALITVANLAAPRLAHRVGARPTIVAGVLVCAGGMAALLAVGPHTPGVAVGLALLPIGIGAGLSVPPLTAALLDAVPAALAGVASGAFNASRQVGGAIGVGLFGALLASHRGASFVHGMRLSLLAAVAALLAAATISAATVGRD